MKFDLACAWKGKLAGLSRSGSQPHGAAKEGVRLNIASECLDGAVSQPSLVSGPFLLCSKLFH